MKEFVKDPSAVIDYDFDWGSEYLATGETIDSATASVTPSGLTIDSDPNTTTVHTIWVSGGTLGEKYLLTSHIVTSDARTDERSIHVVIRDR